MTKQPAAKVAALAEGPPWPKDRFAFQADGQPDVFALDVTLPAGAGGAPVIGAPDSPPADGAGGGTGGDAAPNASDGCAMSSSSAPRAGGTAWLALGLAALLASRHRRSSSVSRSSLQR